MNVESNNSIRPSVFIAADCFKTPINISQATKKLFEIYYFPEVTSHTGSFFRRHEKHDSRYDVERVYEHQAESDEQGDAGRDDVHRDDEGDPDVMYETCHSISPQFNVVVQLPGHDDEYARGQVYVEQVRGDEAGQLDLQGVHRVVAWRRRKGG